MLMPLSLLQLSLSLPSFLLDGRSSGIPTRTVRNGIIHVMIGFVMISCIDVSFHLFISVS
uniref:Uncharacterized protein n=1 Tax=Setaria viridis TaxID=4556 RepID=A0A4U6V9J2_SETVI|nr:hypothetical protein SEVIR_3G151550v2 [Setaria viridis]